VGQSFNWGEHKGSGHLDKAPDAFRTISEVADDLDIPQHVLRFWETRFTQIKPMKRSGGRRYYRPDDVDLLRGIRRLLYGEGYTIRGVQRILKEHGIGSVQRLADASAVASFGAIEEVIGLSILEHDDLAPGIDVDDEERDEADEGRGSRRAGRGRVRHSAAFEEEEEGDDDLIPGVADLPPLFDVSRLKSVLQDLIACRQLLDAALKDG
jgi:DNA-binding transcriptional MerR regulator